MAENEKRVADLIARKCGATRGGGLRDRTPCGRPATRRVVATEFNTFAPNCRGDTYYCSRHIGSWPSKMWKVEKI